MEKHLQKYTFFPTEEYVRLLGRTIWMDDCRILSLSASGVEFQYTGTKLVVTFYGDSTTEVLDEYPQPWKDQTRVGVIVDGKMYLDVMLTKPKQIFEVCFGELEAVVAKHVVRIVKLSEPRMSSCGLGEISILACEPAQPTEPCDTLVEFVGDSITCGFGVDAPNEEYDFSTTTENALKAFAYLASEKLGVDCSLVSYSGHGVLSGYTADAKIQNLSELVLPYYDRFGYSYHSFRGIQVQDFAWNFEKKPDIIVINLGTNDESFVLEDDEKTKQFEDAYVKFLKKIHQFNPKSKIVCAYGLMGDYLYSAEKNAVDRFKEEIDFENIFMCRLSVQDYEKNGYGASYHPSAESHQKAADEFVAFMKTVVMKELSD